ncbi:unnamed protein product [Durusdinium trenchii]|uniref:Protein NLRC3 n=1 Tax=Durusdinium trenchii TaxID=1381693 RepID=A0ABP0J1L2_9DINO
MGPRLCRHANVASPVNTLEEVRLEEIFQQFEEPHTNVMKASHLADAMQLADMNPECFKVEQILEGIGNPHDFTLPEFKQRMKEVHDALRFLQLFDPQKTGVLPRRTIATILQLCRSNFSEERLEEMLKNVPCNRQGFVYSYMVPFLLRPEAAYDLEDPKSLAQFLIDANIRLVRAPYLYKLLRSDRCMPRCQEAERDCCEVNGTEVSALVSHQEVAEWALGRRQAMIISVSHAWETREHPDPCRFQLELLVNCVALWDAAYVDDIWIFYDYVSLFQFQRDTAEQETSFRRAMGNMHMLYAHQSTLTFRLESLTPDETWTARKEDSTYKVPVYHLPSGSIAWISLRDLWENRVLYLSRGWCMAEIEWSAARNIPAQNLAIDGEPGIMTTAKKVPTAPEVFEERMATSAFTHRNDATSVVRLQRKIFHEKVTSRNHMKLQDLTRADMVELAASLPHFQNLKVLQIHGFRAGEGEANAFCEALGSLQLQKLSLAFAPRATGLAMAEALNHSCSVWRFASMTALDFRYCHMGDLGAKVIAEVLKGNTTITHIDLTSNGITDKGVQVLAQALKNNKTLSALNLAHNKISDVAVQVFRLPKPFGREALQDIEERILTNRAAEALDPPPAKSKEDKGERADAFPGRPRIQALADALKLGGDMTQIDLQRELLGNEEIKVLAGALQLNRKVSRIDLSSSHPKITDAGAKAIAQMLLQNKTIITINLAGNAIGRLGVEALAEAVEHNNIVREINLDHNGDVETEALLKRIRTRCEENQRAIARVMVETLLEDLKRDSTKRKIDLSHYCIGDAEVQVLSEALAGNNSITRIYLQGNQITDVGLEAISAALLFNRSITHINLSNNQIKDAGAKALAQVLKQNRSMTYINLSGNHIGIGGMEAIEALADAMQENDTLLELCLHESFREECQAEKRIWERCSANQAAQARAQSS